MTVHDIGTMIGAVIGWELGRVTWPYLLYRLTRRKEDTPTYK